MPNLDENRTPDFLGLFYKAAIIRCYVLEDYEQVIEMVPQVRRYFTTSYVVVFLIEAYYHIGKDKEGREYLEEYLKETSKFWEAHANAFALLYDLQKGDEIIELFTSLVKSSEFENRHTKDCIPRYITALVCYGKAVSIQKRADLRTDLYLLAQVLLFSFSFLTFLILQYVEEAYEQLGKLKFSEYSYEKV